MHAYTSPPPAPLTLRLEREACPMVEWLRQATSQHPPPHVRPVGEKPCPGFVGVRESMAIRLRPSIMKSPRPPTSSWEDALDVDDDATMESVPSSDPPSAPPPSEQTQTAHPRSPEEDITCQNFLCIVVPGSWAQSYERTRVADVSGLEYERCSVSKGMRGQWSKALRQATNEYSHWCL